MSTNIVISRLCFQRTEKVFHAAVDGDLTSADIKNIAFAREDLTLNIGAKVMITVNDPSGQYVNGTIGIIKSKNFTRSFASRKISSLIKYINCQLTLPFAFNYVFNSRSFSKIRISSNRSKSSIIRILFFDCLNK